MLSLLSKSLNQLHLSSILGELPYSDLYRKLLSAMCIVNIQATFIYEFNNSVCSTIYYCIGQYGKLSSSCFEDQQLFHSCLDVLGRQ